MNWPTQDHIFLLKTFQAFSTLLFGAVGMYFTYRWVITMSKVDEHTKTLLAGPTLAPLLSNIDTLQIIGALYLGYAFFWLLMTAAGWKDYLEQFRKRNLSLDRKMKVLHTAKVIP